MEMVCGLFEIQWFPETFYEQNLGNILKIWSQHYMLVFTFLVLKDIVHSMVSLDEFYIYLRFNDHSNLM